MAETTTVDESTRQEELEAAITHELYSQLPLSLLAVFVNLLLLTFFLQDELPSGFLPTWVAVVLVLLLFRLGMWLARRGPPGSWPWLRRRSARFWRVGFLVTVFLTGAAFGAVGYLGIPYPALPYQVFIYFVCGGMAASSVGAYSIEPIAAYANSFPLFVPLTIRLFFLPGDVYVAMAIMGCAFYLMMLLTLHRTSRSSLHTLRLAEQNRSLNDQLEATNRQLRTEIEERAETQRELDEKVTQLDALFQLSPYALFVQSSEGGIIACNPKAESLTGYSEYQLQHRGVRTILPNELEANLQRLLRSPGTRADSFLESYIRRQDGTLLPVEISTKQIPYGEADAILLVLRDDTERRRRLQYVEHLALYDTLTNLSNRRLLLDHMRHSFHEADRSGTAVAVLYMDLDGFKPVNDRFGHECGDHVLQSVATRLRGVSRKSDVTARLGGDEFVVLVKDISERQIVSGLADRFIDSVQAPLTLHDETLRLGLSVGISLYPDNGRTIGDVLRAADSAMYAAKASATERFVFA
jgi:diguanylate cyclase (GGDEF)-like protein/PAS domain S-box-containing protein